LAVAQQLAAENDLLVKGLALEQLVGRGGAKPQPLAVPVVLPAVQPSALDAWLTAAEQNSPTVAQARLGLDVAKLETEKAQAGHLPTVALTGSLGKGRANGDATTFGTAQTFSGNSTTKSVALTVTVPIFSGFAVQNRVKETLALESKSSSDLENARRTVAQSTRSAFFGVQSGLAQVKALEAAESSSKLALESTLLGYKVGVRVNLDVLNAQTQLFQTQRDLAKARYDVIVGGLRLRLASGQLKPDDVAAVNLLLVR
jgi:outer membrane protein